MRLHEHLSVELSKDDARILLAEAIKGTWRVTLTENGMDAMLETIELMDYPILDFTSWLRNRDCYSLAYDAEDLSNLTGYPLTGTLDEALLAAMDLPTCHIGNCYDTTDGGYLIDLP